jgi:hypothetical protein
VTSDVHDRRELVRPQRVGRRGHDASREAWTGAQRLLRVLEPEQQRASPRRELLTGVGQVKLARRTVHERSAELLLQPAQVTARHGQRKPQRARSAGDASGVGDAYEGRHLLKHDGILTPAPRSRPRRGPARPPSRAIDNAGHTRIALKVDCEPWSVAFIATMPGIDPFAGQAGAYEPGCHACHGGDSIARGRHFQASTIGDGVVDRQSIAAPLVAVEPWQAGIEASSSWRRAFAGRVSEASMAARHAMQAAREATRFGAPEYPCRPSKRSGPIPRIGRRDLPSIEGWSSWSRPVTRQAWRDDLPCVEDYPSSIRRSTFHAWRIEVPRDDQRASSSGRST